MRIRPLLFSLVLGASLLPLFAVHAQPVPREGSAEAVDSFAATIDVREDGTIGVSERIEYFFPAPRHGIYRDIPTRYDMDGKIVDIPITVLGVRTPEGVPVPYEIIKNRVSIRIKIGDADRTVSGVQSYVITYSAAGALRYFDDHDELYWNVSGNAWQVPLLRVSADVRLPGKVPNDGIKTKCFTGPAGSTASECVAGVRGVTASFAANGALTVVVAWPPGLVAKVEAKGPGLLDRALPFSPLLVPVLVIVWLYLRWRRHGRDPEGKGTLVVEYGPPAGLTPAEVGVVIDEDAGLKDISAVIVDLAVRGYLKIVEIETQGLILKGTDYEFQRTKDHVNDQTLKPFEKQMLTALFGADGKIARVSDIKNNHMFSDDLPLIKTKLYERLVQDGYFPIDPSKVRAAYAGVGVTILVGTLFIFGPAGMFAGGLFGNALLATAIVGAAILGFAPLMPKKTEKGVAAYEHALGFREYLEKAEKYRMQWQEGENVFEKYLPYAMAFGVVEKWTKAFEGMNLPPPNWYQGRAFSSGSFHPAAFYGALTAMNGAMTTAMASKPQKSGGGSGFGGGGGSGGGGGGGGGGSW